MRGPLQQTQSPTSARNQLGIGRPQQISERSASPKHVSPMLKQNAHITESAAPESTPRPAGRGRPSQLDKQTERARQALQDAGKYVRPAHLMRLLRDVDPGRRDLDTPYDRFRKFVAGKVRSLASETDVERILGWSENKDRPRPFASQAGEAEPLDAFVAGAQKPCQAQPFNAQGAYLLRHAAFLWERHYTTRALAISSLPDGSLQFVDHLANITVEGLTSADADPIEYVHKGVLKFRGKTLQLVSETESQGLGYRCIIADKYAVRNNSASMIVGRMIGMTNKGTAYFRDVLLERIDASPRLWSERSGLVPYDRLSEHDRAMFRYLAKNRQYEDFKDDALDAFKVG